MRDWNAYRERFLRDDVSVRLGGVAANLARIQSVSNEDAHSELVRNMIQDSEYLIEWTAPDAQMDTAGELGEMQIQLALWHHTWEKIWDEHEKRSAIAEQSGKWSERLLDLSGLLNKDSCT